MVETYVEHSRNKGGVLSKKMVEHCRTKSRAESSRSIVQTHLKHRSSTVGTKVEYSRKIGRAESKKNSSLGQMNA